MSTLLDIAGLLRNIALVQKVLQDMVAADCGHDEILCALVHFAAMALTYFVKSIFDYVFVILKF